MAAAPDPGVGFLLENLKDLVASNADLFTGVGQHNIKELESELEGLSDFVKKCTRGIYSDDYFLAGLTKNFRKLIYRAEDVIESLIVNVSKQRSRGAVRGALLAMDHAIEVRNAFKELDSLKREVRSVLKKEKANELLVMSIVDMDKGKDHERTFTKHQVDDDMVGLKDALEDVMGYLTEGPNDLQIVSIVGMLGLGKTTLARQVFKHPTVDYQFFIRAFIVVSQDFKPKEVLLKLVRTFGISAGDMNRMDEHDLREAIRNYLDKRNYLIVLDDVWTEDVWDQFKACFPNNQKGSRVLITTRIRDVAEHAMQGFQFKPYMLRFLNDQESRELLQKRLFGKMDTNKLGLEVHETKILDRCDGLPLAISVAAGILRVHKEESNWWKHVYVQMETYDLPPQVVHEIKLSFNQLPYPLKLCFLYLGVYREDYEIPTRTLYKLWVSEGLVPPDDANETSEDKAENYLEYLVGRSLVMVEKKRWNGQIKTIRIHDMVRGFCKRQAFYEELFREIKPVEEAGIMSSDDDRRLCINSKVSDYFTSGSKRTGKFVRSFLSFAREDYILPLEYNSEIPKAFKFLRVLDIRSIKFTRFPSELFYTFLLKYIALSGELKIIPERLSHLRYLQTLIFNTIYRSIEIKADIWKMKQLRHLETNVSAILQKTIESSVNCNLQTLSRLSLRNCTPEVFKRAPKLKKLGICGELAPSVDALFHSISELECLENLKLLNDGSTTPLICLPNDNNFPPKLTRLTLQNTELSWERMSTLAKLKKLEVLKLKENAFTGRYWDTESTGGFTALKVLHIRATDLVTWLASKGHFPQLTHLYLRDCTMLEGIPSDLVNIATLKSIDIYCCNPKVAISARKLAFAKLQVQAQENNDKSSAHLRLSIYPPDQ